MRVGVVTTGGSWEDLEDQEAQALRRAQLSARREKTFINIIYIISNIFVEVTTTGYRVYIFKKSLRSTLHNNIFLFRLNLF